MSNTAHRDASGEFVKLTGSGASHTPAGSIVETQGVRKTYRLGSRSVEVLRGVDLVVGRGEFVALRGSSGAGKSTLLHLLGGLDSPDEGVVKVCSVNLACAPQSQAARFRNLKIGVVFQSYHLFPELDALENVCVPARLARHGVEASLERARNLLERVGLGGRFEHRPRELSGGEQQRVAIARALINEPELILADEPTGNLDSRTGDEIVDLLCTLRAEKGVTLIVATHDTHVASRAPRVIELVDGQVHAIPGGNP